MVISYLLLREISQSTVKKLSVHVSQKQASVVVI